MRRLDGARESGLGLGRSHAPRPVADLARHGLLRRDALPAAGPPDPPAADGVRRGRATLTSSAGQAGIPKGPPRTARPRSRRAAQRDGSSGLPNGPPSPPSPLFLP